MITFGRRKVAGVSDTPSEAAKEVSAGVRAALFIGLEL
jgi:hypothetical protein